MAMDEQRQDTGRANCGRAHAACLPLTPEVLTHLQVCLSCVELLSGMGLPAESQKALGRLAHAVDALVSMAAAARRNRAASDNGISVGIRVPRS